MAEAVASAQGATERTGGVQAPSPDAIRAYLEDKIAKWWMPDDIVIVEEMPHTATGKISKLTLRQTFKDHKLPTA